MLKTDTPPDPAVLLDVNDVAAIGKCSPRHIWRMVDSGKFPRPITIGAKLKRWPRSTVLAWINAQTSSN